jgi:hypothetical protein
LTAPSYRWTASIALGFLSYRIGDPDTGQFTLVVPSEGNTWSHPILFGYFPYSAPQRYSRPPPDPFCAYPAAA